MRKLNYLVPSLDSFITGGIAMSKALDHLQDKVKADKIKRDELYPVAMERCAAYYKVKILTFENGKEKLDSSSPSYEKCRKMLFRILANVFGTKKPGNASVDPVARIVGIAKSKKAGMTKAQIKRAIRELNALL